MDLNILDLDIYIKNAYIYYRIAVVSQKNFKANFSDVWGHSENNYKVKFYKCSVNNELIRDGNVSDEISGSVLYFMPTLMYFIAHKCIRIFFQFTKC